MNILLNIFLLVLRNKHDYWNFPRCIWNEYGWPLSNMGLNCSFILICCFATVNWTVSLASALCTDWNPHITYSWPSVYAVPPYPCRTVVFIAEKIFVEVDLYNLNLLCSRVSYTSVSAESADTELWIQRKWVYRETTKVIYGFSTMGVWGCGVGAWCPNPCVVQEQLYNLQFIVETWG